MAKLTLTDLTQLSSNETSAVTAINNNNTAIEAALELTLTRSGTAPNTLTADLDMNSKKLLNLANPTANGHAVNKVYGDANYGGAAATAAATSATAAAASAVTATNYAVKVNGVAAGSDHSAKAWAIGGTGITDTSSKGAAKEWASNPEDDTVAGSGTFSALHYSAKATAQASIATTQANTATTKAGEASVSATAAAASAAGIYWKEPVKAASTGNLTLSGTQTVDGISLSVGNRILVKNQSSAPTNGVYVVASSTWARSVPLNAWDEFVGAAVIVSQGSVNADTAWICTVDAGGSLGSTAITWGAFGVGDLKGSNNLSDVSSAATAFGNLKQAASATATGVVELATDAETITGTDTARAITAANLAATFPTIRNIPQNSKSAAYPIVLADAGKHLYHPGGDTSARIWTIPANASIPFPIGSAITFVNDTGGGVISIAIASDVLVLSPAGTTGTRALAANGVATCIKMTATRWMISGSGLT